MIRAVTLFPLAAILLVSCSHTTDPGPCDDPRCFFESASLEIDHDVERFRDSTVERTNVEALFKVQGSPDDPGSYYLVGAGDVRFNSVELRRSDAGYPGLNYYRAGSDSDSIRLAPPASFNRWMVEGSSNIPPFSDSIATPDDDFRVTTPRPGDTLSLSRDLLFLWNTPGSADGIDSSVAITVVQGDEPDDRVTLGSWSSYRSGEGSTVGSRLRSLGFRPGPAEIFVARTIVQHRFAPGMVHYTMKFMQEEIVHVILSD